MARKDQEKENAELLIWMRESAWWILGGALAAVIGWNFDTSYGQYDPITRIGDFLLSYGGPVAVGYGFLRLFSR